MRRSPVGDRCPDRHHLLPGAHCGRLECSADGRAKESHLLGVNSLSLTQRQLVDSLVTELSAIDGVRTIVLGGSFARGCARPDSDVDLGVLYDENGPFKIEALRNLAARL